MNRLFWCQILIASACATPPVDATSANAPTDGPRVEADSARVACEQAAATTAECVDILTRPQIESRQEVEAAEAAREADAFRGRLAGLREAVERRRRPSIRTTTAAVARLLGRTPSARGANAEPVELIEPPELLPNAPLSNEAPSPDSKASLASKGSPASNSSGVSPAVVSPKKVAGSSTPGGSGLGAAPTPEVYLRAGHCLLKSDHAQGMTALGGYRRGSSSDKTLAGQWALTLTDVTALIARIDQEMAHRKLAKPGPVCMSSQIRPMVGLLRVLVGPKPTAANRVDGYGRGLGRLERELEVRAGLPRAP